MANNFKKIFREWILSDDLSKEKQEEIKNLIAIFSEFIFLTNADYSYNKTYLTDFSSDFLLCKEKLKKKYEIINNIIGRLLVEKIDLKYLRVFIVEGGKTLAAWRRLSFRTHVTHIHARYIHVRYI